MERLAPYLVCLFLLISGNSWAARFSAHVDRSRVALGETLQLILELQGSSNLSPDLSSLSKDFSILENAVSQQFVSINGSMRRSKKWIIVLSPKRRGSLTIPAIALGKQKSGTISIRVTKPSSMNTQGQLKVLFIRVDAQPRSPVVQSQVLYTLRLYYARNLGSGSTLTPPQLDNAIISQLGKDKNYQTTINNQPYRVIERRYVIFPQSSGRQAITPPIFQGTINLPQGNSPLDQLFGSTLQRKIRRSAPEINLTVAPIPAGLSANNWLPAQSVHLEEHFSSATFRVGEPITRTIILTALGLDASQLPALSQPSLENTNVYPDKPEQHNRAMEKGLEGERIYKMAFVPTHTGSITLPRITIPWWNTRTKKIETATLPQHSFHVLPALNAQDTVARNAAPAPITATTTSHTPWWLAIMSLFLGTLIYMAWRRYRPTPSTTVPEDVHEKKLWFTLAKACEDNQAKACKKALLHWSHAHWPHAQLRNLGELAAFTAGHPVSALIRTLDKQLYARKQEGWRGKELLNALKQYLTREKTVKKSQGKGASPLPSLYPR